ncbi:hypothetical protein BN134_1540 [Cronobacter dublinensis 1210]|uniref:Uncharacterized protein n=1 Tax=Cronobacter dublinensis 1210 TaxID=1208656 RepID=A0ABP1W639_9ENTR|nr:hypothetical protein BN134_1540 [Cronobacter dublinensis 1210]
MKKPGKPGFFYCCARRLIYLNANGRHYPLPVYFRWQENKTA